MEPLVCVLLQVGRKVQIVVSRNGRHMAQIRGQMRQLALDIHSLPVPAMQGLDGKTVPQIVKARGSAAFIQNTSCQAQLLPVISEGCALYALADARRLLLHSRNASGSVPRRWRRRNFR